MFVKKIVIQTYGTLRKLLGHPWPILEMDHLLQRAEKITGYSDFGPDNFKTGLFHILASAREDKRLTLFGKFCLYQDCLSFLCSRLALFHAIRAYPENFKKDIKRPLVLAGLPRTGSTFLFNLLAQDDQFATPLTWEFASLFPNPPETDKTRDTLRIRKVQRDIDLFHSSVPEIKKIHFTHALAPEECTVPFNISFTSIGPDIRYNLPRYRSYLTSENMDSTYALHKKTLQYLQMNKEVKTWLVKHPAHGGYLKSLLTTYPDAHIIQTHRDLKKVIPSLCSLYHTLRSGVRKNGDPTALGSEVIHSWGSILARCLEFRSMHPEIKHQFLDVDFEDLVSHPMKVIQTIYSHFGLLLTPETIEKMERYVQINKRYKEGKHGYHSSDFGLEDDFDLKTETFRNYSEQFLNLKNNYD